MGAVSFYHEVEGASASKCFDILVEQARRLHGFDSYNGTISTCELGRVKKVADKYSESVKKKAKQMIEDDNYGQKWVATCLDLGVVRYEVISATKSPVTAKEKAKFVQKYVVMEDYQPYKHYDTKSEAEEAALEMALHYPNAYYCVCKRPVNVNHGEEKTSEIKITTDVKKTKPKTVKKNSKVHEIHKYIFYGLAAE